MLKLALKAAIAASALLALGGCLIIDADSDEIRVDRGQKACKAGNYQYLIGTPVSEIDRSKLPAAFRVICHNCPATMDYREDRLSIQLGPDSKVLTAACN
jgi:hypothetical protein